MAIFATLDPVKVFTIGVFVSGFFTTFSRFFLATILGFQVGSVPMAFAGTTSKSGSASTSTRPATATYKVTQTLVAPRHDNSQQANNTNRRQTYPGYENETSSGYSGAGGYLNGHYRRQNSSGQGEDSSYSSSKKAPSFRGGTSQFKGPQISGFSGRQNYYSENSRKNQSDQNSNFAQRARSNFAPSSLLGQNYARYNGSPKYGFLSPTVANLVLNPLFMGLPFNIWHSSHENDGAYITENFYGGGSYSDDYTTLTDNLSGNSASPEVIQKKTEVYNGGEAGSSEINQDLPPWLQASLRLMSTTQKSPGVADPVITPLNMTEQEFDSKVASIDDAVKQLAQSKIELQNLLQISQQRPVLEAKQEAAEQKIIDLNNTAVENLRLLEISRNKEKRADERIIEVQNQSHWCLWTQSLTDLVCNFVAGAEISAKIKLKEEQDEYRRRNRLAFESKQLSETEVIEIKSQIKANTLRLSESHFGPSVDESQIISLQNEIQTKIDKNYSHLPKLSGFVTWNPSGFRLAGVTTEQCPKQMYVYRFVGTSGTRHPFFKEEVEPDLLPKDDAKLVVCLNEDERISSVHIFENRTELYSSMVGRDEDKRVNLLTVSTSGLLNSPPKAEVLEQHFWAYQPSGDIIYGLKFKNGETTESIRTIIPQQVQ